MICWNCSYNIDLKENKIFFNAKSKEKYVHCPDCSAENSIEIINHKQKGDEEMAVNYKDDKYAGKFVYLPKQGESAEFDIKEIKEVQSDNVKFNFSINEPVTINGQQAIDDDGEPVFKKKDLGYHIEAELKNGKILSVTNLSSFKSVFVKNNIQDGEKVRVSHPDKGIWKVERL